MKFRVTINRVIDIDTERDWSVDTRVRLLEELDAMGVENREASPEEIHDAIRTMLDDDIDEVIGDEGPVSTDYDIEIREDVSLFVPPKGDE